MVERTDNKKVVIAIHGLSHAGAERVAASWASYLAQKGHEVAILVYACGEENFDLDEKVRLIPIADSSEAYAQMAKMKRLCHIRKIIRRENPEILLSFLPKMQIQMMLATFGMRIKRIETVRNNPWIDRDVGNKRFLWNQCFQRSDAIVVQTEEQAQYFPVKLQKKITVINNPISRDFAEQVKHYGEGRICRFVSVARISPQKNYSMMVRAFAKAVQEDSNCKLDIYGAGTEKAVAELQALIEELGMEKNITLCGWRKDISQILTSYDGFLMSSDYEGMPNALAEAMATGLVCLSTDCKTGPKDMIEDGHNGFLAVTGNVDSFTEGIRKMMELDQQQCTAMGAAAREKILTMCSEDSTLARMERLIKDM